MNCTSSPWFPAIAIFFLSQQITINFRHKKNEVSSYELKIIIISFNNDEFTSGTYLREKSILFCSSKFQPTLGPDNLKQLAIFFIFLMAS